MTAQGVRRDKAALSSGCKPHPATAPAGSNRSRHGGDVLVVKDHQGKLAPAAHPERGRPLRAMNSGNASSALAPLTTCVVQCRSLLHCCSRFPGPDRLMAPAMQQSQAALREKRENQVRKRLAATRRLSDLRLGVEPAFGRRPDSRKSRFAQDSLLKGTGIRTLGPRLRKGESLSRCRPHGGDKRRSRNGGPPLPGALAITARAPIMAPCGGRRRLLSV